jgi:hypothetical protein
MPAKRPIAHRFFDLEADVDKGQEEEEDEEEDGLGGSRIFMLVIHTH